MYSLKRILSLPHCLLPMGRAKNTTSKVHPDQMPKTSQPSLLDVEEWWLYSEPILDVWAPHPMAKPSYTTEETHFCCCYSGSHSCSHYPRLRSVNCFLFPQEQTNVTSALLQMLLLSTYQSRTPFFRSLFPYEQDLRTLFYLRQQLFPTPHWAINSFPAKDHSLRPMGLFF